MSIGSESGEFFVSPRNYKCALELNAVLFEWGKKITNKQIKTTKQKQHAHTKGYHIMRAYCQNRWITI